MAETDPRGAVRAIRATLRRAIDEGRQGIVIRLTTVYMDELVRIKGRVPETFDGFPIERAGHNLPSVVRWSEPNGGVGMWHILPFW